MKEEYLYICDKQPGACRSWERYGWTKCQSIVGCCHTANKEHAKYKDGTKFITLQQGMEKAVHFEYIRSCKDKPYACSQIFEWCGDTLCLEKNCPLNTPEE